jgi:hypothetical protein
MQGKGECTMRKTIQVERRRKEFNVNPDDEENANSVRVALMGDSTINNEDWVELDKPRGRENK